MADRPVSLRIAARSLGRIVLAAACALTVTACISAKEQRAADQNRCYGFGFQPGTDAFAECMMGIDQHREALAQDRRIETQRQNLARFWENEREWERRRNQQR